MAQFENAALKRFVDKIKTDFVLAQIRISRAGDGFELRHVDDEQKPTADLKPIGLGELRGIVEFTGAGQFRPLKSAPNLRKGWFLFVKDGSELGCALDQFYPNAVADWFSVDCGTPRITDYRTFTGRQTGMYRITTMLDDRQAGAMIKACCDGRFCLKRRLWTIPGLPEDGAHEKSAIPCLEPCAVLLEFARKAMRIEQEETISLKISASDASTLEEALAIALQHPRSEVREADFASPANPRRFQLTLEKLRGGGIKLANAEQDE